MSVVVAIKDGDKIWVGCDSQVTIGYTKQTLNSQKKIWKPSDDKEIIMGLVGDLRDANLLSTSENWLPKWEKANNEIDFKYIVRNLVNKLFNELSNFGRLRIKDGIKYMDSHVMFAFKNQCYAIYDDGAVVEIKDILAIGSGYTQALGAYNTIKHSRDLTAKEKLIRCIKASCENDLYVNYPIIIMNTQDNEVLVVDR